MPEQGIVLSESDRALLQSVLDRVRRDLPHKTAHPPPESGDFLPPEVFAVLSPDSGIPARVGLTLGAAECDVYRVTDGVLERAGFSKTVWNLTTDDQPGGEFLEARRDKFGTWLVGAGGVAASGSGSGSGFGAGPVFDVVTNVCPLSGSPGGFQVERVRVTLPPGAVVGKAVCVDNPAGCCGDTGTGTGTGTGGTVTVPCCPDPVPQTLHLTVAGGPPCMAGTFVLTWQPATSDWRGNGNDCTGAIKPTTWRLICPSAASGWTLYWNCPTSAGATTSTGAQVTTTQCSPFHLAGGGTSLATNCYAGGVGFTWDLTA